MGLINIQNTNFDNGITNRNAADLFGSMGHLDPTKFITHFDDFHAPSIGGISAGDLDGYTASASGTVVAADEDGGAVSLITGATDTNTAVIQTVSQGFSIVASRPVYFRCKLDLDDVVESVLIAGLSDGLAVAPANGVIFRKADNAAAVDLLVRSGSGDIVVSGTVTTLVNDVQVALAFYWDGIDRIYFGVNGVATGFVTVPTLPVGLLAPTVGPITGATAIKTAVVDYLFASQER